MTRRNNLIQCGVDSPQIARKLGELRSTALTTTRSNACFLVGIDTVYNGYSGSVNPISARKTIKTQIFLYFYTKNRLNSIKLHKLVRNTKRLGLIECIEFVMFNSIRYLLSTQYTKHNRSLRSSTKQEQHLRHVYKSNYI